MVVDVRLDMSTLLGDPDDDVVEGGFLQLNVAAQAGGIVGGDQAVPTRAVPAQTDHQAREVERKIVRAATGQAVRLHEVVQR
jgi:hypothetical protein